MTKEEFCNLYIFKDIKCKPDLFGKIYDAVGNTVVNIELKKILAIMQEDLKAKGMLSE